MLSAHLFLIFLKNTFIDFFFNPPNISLKNLEIHTSAFVFSGCEVAADIVFCMCVTYGEQSYLTKLPLFIMTYMVIAVDTAPGPVKLCFVNLVKN